jgi:hypothetical protein
MPQPRQPARLAVADTTEAVDAFMASLEHPLKAEIETIRRTILGAARGIHEGIKWNSPSFRTTEYFATVNLREKSGIGVILHLGARVKRLPAGGVAITDPGKLLKWLGKDRAMVVFTDKSDLKAKKAGFAKIIRQWVAYV